MMGGLNSNLCLSIKYVIKTQETQLCCSNLLESLCWVNLILFKNLMMSLSNFCHNGKIIFK